jgi:hypothetical protein
MNVETKEHIDDQCYRILQILEFGGNVPEHVINKVFSKFSKTSLQNIVLEGTENGCNI